MGTSKKKAKCQIRFFSQKINVGSHVTEALGVQGHCVEPGFLGLCPSHEPVESPLTQRWVTTCPGGSAHPPLPLLRDHRQRTWVLRASPAPPRKPYGRKGNMPGGARSDASRASQPGQSAHQGSHARNWLEICLLEVRS